VLEKSLKVINVMSKDQLVGMLILVGAVVVLGIYGYKLWLGPTWQLYALLIVGTVAVVGVMGIIAWIGWTMATTPAPTPIEGLEGNASLQAAEEEKKETKKET
jgi:hypothetical protein